MHARTAIALFVFLLAACGGAAPPYPGPGQAAAPPELPATPSAAAATPLPAATVPPLAGSPAVVLGAQETAHTATPGAGQPAGVGTAFELALGEQAALADGALQVRFVAVPEDSRCPADSQCIWAGRVVVGIEATERGVAAQSITLGLPGGITPDAPELQTVGAYTLRLLGVEPYPASSGDPPNPYVATLLVDER